MTRRPTILAVIAVAFLVSCNKDHLAEAKNPISWSVSSVSGLLQPASTDTVRFAAALDSGWYIYSLTQKTGGPTPMSVSIEPSPPFSIVGNVSGPTPVTIFDKEFNITTERYVGSPAFSAVVAIAQGATNRPSSANLKVRYQACNATLCLPARTETLTTPVRIAAPQ